MDPFLTRRSATLLLAAFLAVAGIVLLVEDRWFGLSRLSYSYSHALAEPDAARLTRSPVVLVYLDMASHEASHQSPQHPWDRSLHARLIRQLTAAGAKAIVFDILFVDDGPDPAADLDLERAIRESGRVLLAAELSRSTRDTLSSPGAVSQGLTLPIDRFRSAAAGTGLANLIVDDDFIVRRYFDRSGLHDRNSLTAEVARLLNLAPLRIPPQGLWLRYQGRALRLPHVGYTQAIDPQGAPPDFFRNKVVLVGARPITGEFAERRDEFRSPFPSWSRDLFMPAVEVHATQMLNRIEDGWLRRLSMASEAGILAAFALLLAWAFTRLRPLQGAVAAAAAGLGTLLAAHLAFDGLSLFFPWMIVAAVQIPAGFAGAASLHSVEWYRTRRRMERQRRESEEKIREQAALIDKAQDAIVLADPGGRILYANPSAEQLFGWSQPELATAAVSNELFAPSRQSADTARTATLSGGDWQGELELATRTGTRVLVESRWTLIRDDLGRAKSLLLINTDVTEKRRIERQFLRSQRLESVWSLAGGMAHDLNNALAPVLLGIQRLRRRPQDDSTQRMLEVMEDNTHRSADMVRQVLTFSRGQDDGREVLDPGRLLQEMQQIAALAFPKSIRISAMIPPDLWRIQGNRTQLHQVLLNLCVNARDAMAQGGDLTLAADNVTLGAGEAAEMPGGRPGAWVMILVADTGSGIPPEVLPRLFEPFFTTKSAEGGTGLGLSTSAHIVKSHGGFLNVRSEVGAGTTFEIYLPKSATGAASHEPPEQGDSLQGRGERILVVDDELSIREMLASTLKEHGYDVLCAAGGAEALSMLGQDGSRVALVLLDLEMPMMDGAATLHEIHSRWATLPVVLMEGRGRAAPGDPGVPACPVLRKPFGMDSLLVAVRERLTAR